MECDLAIIGSGPAGMSLALEFADTDTNVILIESGGLTATPASLSLNKGPNIGQGYYPLHQTRSRFLGGSSNCWAGWCAPLDPSDFDTHDWIPKSGWPITYADLSTYYAAAGKRLQLSERSFTPNDWVGKSAPIWDVGSGFETAMYKFSPPTRFGTVYRKRLKTAKHLTCLLNATVTQVEVIPSGAHVSGLAVQQTSGTRTLQVVAKRYVLAAGGIENARILLASNRTVSQGVGNASGNVGRYFMEHPHLHSEGRFYRTVPMPSLKLYTRHQQQKQFVKAYLRIPAELRRERKLLNLALCLEPVHRTRISKVHRDLIQSAAETDGTSLAVTKKGEPKLMSCDMRAEQVPNPDSRVTLTNEKDALGMPRVALDWRLTAIDKDSMRRTQAYFAQRLMLKGWSRFLQRLDDTDQFPKRVKGGCHHMGTTRMTADPKDGVVDANCRVHGMDNLFVAGSSVFPTAGAANPTLTIVALSMRLSEHLKKELS